MRKMGFRVVKKNMTIPKLRVKIKKTKVGIFNPFSIFSSRKSFLRMIDVFLAVNRPIFHEITGFELILCFFIHPRIKKKVVPRSQQISHFIAKHLNNLNIHFIFEKRQEFHAK